LSKLKTLEKDSETTIHPILGVGSKPFRGHLSPDNIDNFLQEYRGLSTVTIQSAFRYDYTNEQVKEASEPLTSDYQTAHAEFIDRRKKTILKGIMAKCRKEYERQIELMAPFINAVAAYVPARRTRKLHIGLFGYSRCVAGVCLPRAISFASALYSVGIPPEFIGMKALNQLNEQEWSLLSKHYIKMTYDLKVVGEYVSLSNINMLTEMSPITAKRSGMSEEQLKDALTSVIEDLNTAEQKLGIKLGP
jgi:phosphoenolpyruvate carboxylase